MTEQLVDEIVSLMIDIGYYEKLSIDVRDRDNFFNYLYIIKNLKKKHTECMNELMGDCK